MTLWVIVPVKPFRRGKSRLSGVLTEEERAQLNHALLENTLHALTGNRDINEVMVVTRDSAAIALTRECGFRTLQEDDENSDLNLALTRAAKVAQFAGATWILVLPADLPLLKPGTIASLLRQKKGSPAILIAPDRREDGTNALLMSPPDALRFEFGAQSFHKHVKQAQERKLPVQIIHDKALELDLDIPDDLDYLEEMSQETVDIPQDRA